MSFSRVALLGAMVIAVWGVPALAAEAPLVFRQTDQALKWSACPPVFPTGCEIGVLHGDPSKPNADVFLRVRGGQTLPAHTHTSAERMVLVSGRLNVKYQGAPEVALTSGAYAYGPAGLPHRATCVGPGACTLFIAFEGPVDAMGHSAPLD